MRKVHITKPSRDLRQRLSPPTGVKLKDDSGGLVESDPANKGEWEADQLLDATLEYCNNSQSRELKGHIRAVYVS